MLVASAIAFGVGVMLFGLSPWLLLSLVLVTMVGYVGSTYDATMSTVLQVSAREDMRGRVLGLYYATFGLNQLGALGIGAVASVLGLPVALAIAGAILPLCALGLMPSLHAFNMPRAERSNTADGPHTQHTGPRPGGPGTRVRNPRGGAAPNGVTRPNAAR